MNCSDRDLVAIADSLREGDVAEIEGGFLAAILYELAERRDEVRALSSDLRFAADECGELFLALREFQEPKRPFRPPTTVQADWNPPAWSRRIPPELEELVRENTAALRHLGLT